MILISLAFASEEGFLREPYLQSMTPSEVTVVWMQDTEHDARLCWGRNKNDLDRIKTFNKEKVQFEAVLKDLEPDTVYHYQVEDLSRGFTTDLKTFRTPPEVGTKARTRFWVVGDSGNGSLDQREVFAVMQEHTRYREPDHFLHVGDMAYGSGLEVEFTLFFYWVYEELIDEVPVWPAMGNHEGYTSNSQKQAGPYYEGYVLPKDGRAGGVASGTEAYYSFDIANVHFVVLDSYETSREPEDAMLTWMVEDLAATEQDWVIAFWHHPAYSKGSHDSDTERNLIEMRENAVPLLEAAGVDLVLAGHSHVYERSYLLDGAYETPTTDAGIRDGGMGQLPDPYTKPLGLFANRGAVYVTAGHGGASVRAQARHPVMASVEAEHGSVLLDVQGPVLRLRNLRIDGALSDTMTLVKGPAVVFEGPDDGDLEAGQVLELSATRVGIDEEVRFEWSCNGGHDWLPIESPWTVPDIASDRVLLRALAGFGEDWSDGGLAIDGSEPCPTPLADTGLDGGDEDPTGCAVAPGAAWLLALGLLWRRST